jgi:hypothetical protein
MIFIKVDLPAPFAPVKAICPSYEQVGNKLPLHDARSQPYEVRTYRSFYVFSAAEARRNGNLQGTVLRTVRQRH